MELFRRGEVYKPKECVRVQLLTPPSSEAPPAIGFSTGPCDQCIGDRSPQDNSQTSGSTLVLRFRYPDSLCTLEPKMIGICITLYLFFLDVTLTLLSPSAVPIGYPDVVCNKVITAKSPSRHSRVRTTHKPSMTDRPLTAEPQKSLI